MSSRTGLSSLAAKSGKRPASAISSSVSEYTHSGRNVRQREGTGARDCDLPPSPASSTQRPALRGASMASSGQAQARVQVQERMPDIVYGGDEEDEEDAGKGLAVLALHAPGQNNLAAAYYDADTRKLQVLEDTKDTWGWDLAVLLVEQFQPDQVVLSTAAPDALTKLVQDYCIQNPQTKLRALPHTNYTHTMATYHLAGVRLPHGGAVVAARDSDLSWSDSGRGGGGAVPSDGSNTGEGDDGAGMGRLRLSLLKMGCRVNVDAPYAVCAAGALLSYLIRSESKEMRGSEDAGVELKGIESMDLDEYMIINQDALTSIGVFDVESHANMHNKRNKPGMSLNGVINTTITPLGRKLFHTWLLRPLISIDRINERLDAVQLLSARDYHDIRRNIKRDFKNIKNIVAFCHKIRSGRASWKDWLGLVDYIRSAVSIKDNLAVFNLRGTLHVSKKIKEAINDEVQLFLMDILQLIDWDASREAGENHICIHSRIDAEVDEWRENLAGLDAFLSATGKEMLNRIPHALCHSLRVLYLPQLGCLVSLHGLSSVSDVPAQWDHQFETDDAVYFKTPEMNQLDDHFGDLQNIIMDREIEWVQALAERLPDVEDHLQAAGEALAELDCLLAFADAVDRFDLRRPVMRVKPVLKIRKGFHPLHAMCVPSGQYIDNDTVLQGGGGKDVAGMMVVTGANGSGKSAYGKQVALITFMAHIGCFVPAESAEIGICDKIFTRVQTRESSSKTASAFMIDLSQVSQALRGATQRSLLILDEFGKGTTTTDGAALLAGVISWLLKGPNPRTVLLTHYHQLFAQQFIDKSSSIIYCHMKSFIAEGSQVLTYLYKLSPTLSLTSNAAECALMHGIPPELVDRARFVSDCVSKFQITKLIDATLTDEDLEELAQAEDLAKRFLSWDLQEEDDGILDQLREMFVTVEEEVVLEPGEGAAGVTSLEHQAMSEAEAGQEQEDEEDEDEVKTSVPTEVVDLTDE